MKKILSEVVRKVSMLEIDPPEKDQRITINQEDVEELAGSIKEVGLQQPILITPKNGRYEVVWGHRRYLAHKFLGKTQIFAKIQNIEKDQKIILRATENLFRVGITPIEEAYVYSDLIQSEEMNIEQIAKRIKKSVGLIRRRLDLLRMPQILQDAIHKRKIKYGVAESLWALGDTNAIEYYLQFAIENGATVEVVRQWVKDEKDKKRREQADLGNGRGTISVNEPVPQYIACDICKNPTEMGKETIIRTCKNCTKGIIEAMQGG